MRSLALRLALTIYLFIWFGLIVPGHRKGIVTLPGTESCCFCFPPPASPAKPGDTTPMPPSRVAHCAICNFAAHLTIPPTIDFTLAPFGLLHILPIPQAEDRVARIVITPFDERGPPMV